MIAIIDSGIANLRSVEKGFEKAGVPAQVVRESRQLRDAAGIVLPGVGAFADGIATLEAAGFIDPLLRGIQSGKLILGICLGLHFLFSESEEFGLHKGLDLIRGRVRRFPNAVPPSALSPQSSVLKVPQMGWNQVYVEPEEEGTIAGITEYGIPFTSMIWRDNLFATQFHPEKSQALGLQILANFGRLAHK
jgi:glutamine amidotransferase